MHNLRPSFKHPSLDQRLVAGSDCVSLTIWGGFDRCSRVGWSGTARHPLRALRRAHGADAELQA